jgi:hypothetical protein
MLVLQARHRVLIGMGSRRRSASQAIDLPSDGRVNFERLFTGNVHNADGALHDDALYGSDSLSNGAAIE